MSFRSASGAEDAPEFAAPAVRLVFGDLFADMREDPVPGALADVERLAIARVDEPLTSAVYLDRQAEVDRYLLAAERLSSVACARQDAPEVIGEVIADVKTADEQCLQTRGGRSP